MNKLCRLKSFCFRLKASLDKFSIALKLVLCKFNILTVRDFYMHADSKFRFNIILAGLAGKRILKSSSIKDLNKIYKNVIKNKESNI